MDVSLLMLSFVVAAREQISVGLMQRHEPNSSAARPNPGLGSRLPAGEGDHQKPLSRLAVPDGHVFQVQGILLMSAFTCTSLYDDSWLSSSSARSRQGVFDVQYAAAVLAEAVRVPRGVDSKTS